MAGPDDPDLVGLDDVEWLDDDAASEAVARGRALFTAGRVAEAAAAFGAALSADPASADALYGLGKSLAAADPPRARDALERAAALRPGSFEAWRALALLCLAQRDREAAARAGARARDAAPSDEARDVLARDLAGIV